MCRQNEYPLAYIDFLYRNYQHKYKVHPKMYEIYIFGLFTISVESGNKFQSMLLARIEVHFTDSPMSGTPSREPGWEPRLKLFLRQLG